MGEINAPELEPMNEIDLREFQELGEQIRVLGAGLKDDMQHIVDLQARVARLIDANNRLQFQ